VHINKKLTIEELQSKKGMTPIAILTAYTYPISKELEAAGIPLILVGDTLGMVEMGYNSTQEVTMNDMVYHISAVRRGAPNTHIIGDLPYLSDSSPALALENSQRLLDAGADSIKLEGPKYDVVEFLLKNGVYVVGHLGLTPQTAQNFKQVGKDEDEANQIKLQADALVKAGVFLLVLEHIPSDLASELTHNVSVPTIGIGAGQEVDGQVLVINDVIGVGEKWPPFSKQYAHVGKTVREAAAIFKHEVETKVFDPYQ
jgi:3-methyl-2-oxobutanoate hydroxymethyltransferase